MDFRVMDHFRSLGQWWVVSHCLKFYPHSWANQPPPSLIKTSSNHETIKSFELKSNLVQVSLLAPTCSPDMKWSVKHYSEG